MSYLEESISSFLERISAREPAPGGGSVAATTVALAASLAAMAARFSTENLDEARDLAERAESLRDRAAALVKEDAAIYGRVLEAKRSGGDVRDALSRAADVPLTLAGLGAEVVEVSLTLARDGNPNLRGDALTASFLAGASVRSAVSLVEINLKDANLAEDTRLEEARELLRRVESSLAALDPVDPSEIRKIRK